jgi:hypothetical protein
MATAKRPRTLDSFFKPPPPKRSRIDETKANDTKDSSIAKPSHPTYPFPVSDLPAEIVEALNFAPEDEGKAITDKPDLDLLYYQPYIPKQTARDLFTFLRAELFFYRVQYNIKRGPTETLINTPRYTTVFGVDETSRFDDDINSKEKEQSKTLVDASTGKPVAKNAYKVQPRPIPLRPGELLRVRRRQHQLPQRRRALPGSAAGDSVFHSRRSERFSHEAQADGAEGRVRDQADEAAVGEWRYGSHEGQDAELLAA